MSKTMLKASELLTMLKWKHSDDIFISECKDGGTWDRMSHRRLDAWVIRTSFSNPLTIGYEIKVSRSDFLGDKKWQDYLPLCNEFYFVCPNGLIQPGELPEGIGLIWTTKNGKSLRKKKPAYRREIVIPESMYRYIIFSRCEVVDREKLQRQRSTRKYWEKWLKRKRLSGDFGEHVSKSIAKKVQAEIHNIELKRQDTERVNRRLSDIKKFVEEMGINIHAWDSVNKVKEILEGDNSCRG